MSIAAMNWAMAQRTGSPSAQCVLYVLADVASPDGVCFPSIGYVAERSQQSADTVRRRLKDLEEAGLLVRFERHDPNGRRSSDEIRLQMGAAAVSLDEPQDGDSPPASAPGSGPDPAGGDPRRLQGGALANCKGPLAPVQGGPSQLCKGHNEPSSEPSPPSSPPGDALPAGAPRADRGAEGEPPLLSAFREAFPEPSTIPALVARLFTALDAGEQRKAVEAAKGYAVYCRKRKRKPMEPHRFLRDPSLFDEFAKHAPAPPPERHFVTEGSRAWRAWLVFFAIRDPEPVNVQARPGPDGETGAWFARPAPPGGEQLADFAGEDGAPDLESWVLIEHGSREWWAWNDRLQRWTGKPLADALVTRPGEVQRRVVLGREEVLPTRLRGRLLPSLWPPPLPEEEKLRPAKGADEAAQAQETSS